MYPVPDHHMVVGVDGVGRACVGELYEVFDPPPYDGGVYTLDLAAHGMVGKYVFFEDDPQHVYAVSYAAEICGDGMSAIELALQKRRAT